MNTYVLHEVTKGFNLTDPSEHDAIHVTVKKTDDDGDVTYHTFALSDAALTDVAKADGRTDWAWSDVAGAAATRIGKAAVLVPVVLEVAEPQPDIANGAEA